MWFLSSNWKASRSRPLTIILSSLNDRSAGSPIPDTGERQHLDLVKQVLPQAGQQERKRVVPSHHLTAELVFHIFGSEQNLQEKKEMVRRVTLLGSEGRFRGSI